MKKNLKMDGCNLKQKSCKFKFKLKYYYFVHCYYL